MLQISKGNITASFSEIGAALIGLRFGEIETIAQPVIPGKQVYHGSVLAPWCNRTEAGKWTDPHGTLRSFPINEPAQNNALHGLVYESVFSVSEKTDHSVKFEIVIGPTEGYPYQVNLSTQYKISDHGLVVSFEAVNLGDSAAPFALAFHPYFRFSSFDTGDLKIFATARSFYRQNKNQIPIEKVSVTGEKQDLRSGKLVRTAGLDDYYTDLDFENGVAISKLVAPNGSGIEIWQDGIFKHLVVYTTDEFPSVDGPVSATAIEPSTSEANALNRQEDLLWLEPQGSASGSWGVKLLAN